jgi:hypothetical protein
VSSILRGALLQVVSFTRMVFIIEQEEVVR